MEKPQEFDEISLNFDSKTHVWDSGFALTSSDKTLKHGCDLQ